MAIEIWEVFQSRDLDLHPGTANTIQLLYHLRGSDDEQALIAQLDTTAPTTWPNPNGGSLQRYKTGIKQIGRREWRGTAEYTDPAQIKLLLPSAPGTFSFGCDVEIGGETTNVQVGESFTAYGAGAPAPDHMGLIGVKKTAGKCVEATGVDIPSGGCKINYKFERPNSFFTPAYVVALVRMANPPKTNNAPFKGFAIGELLFVGGRISQSSQENGQCELIFWPRENRTAVRIDTINGQVMFNKKGHEYVDVFKVETIDPASGEKVMQPLAVYVHKMFQEGDFSIFGIGT